MKSILWVMGLIMATIFWAGCKKSGGDSATTLTGNWELRFVEGGYRTSGASGSFPPGNGNILKFKDLNYWSYSNGQARDSGKYQIKKDTLSPNGKKMDKLTILHQTYNIDYFFQLSNNMLTLYFGTIAADGTVSTYVRLDPSQINPALQ